MSGNARYVTFLSANLDCREYDLDNVGNITHDEAVASDMTIKNEDQDKDIIFSCNDGGVQTEIMKLDGSAGQLSGMQKAVAGVMTNATLSDWQPAPDSWDSAGTEGMIAYDDNYLYICVGTNTWGRTALATGWTNVTTTTTTEAVTTTTTTAP